MFIFTALSWLTFINGVYHRKQIELAATLLTVFLTRLSMINNALYTVDVPQLLKGQSENFKKC
jgi:hypothetical protein